MGVYGAELKRLYDLLDEKPTAQNIDDSVSRTWKCFQKAKNLEEYKKTVVKWNFVLNIQTSVYTGQLYCLSS